VIVSRWATIAAAGLILAAGIARVNAQQAAGGARRTISDGLYTPAQAARGQEVYEKHCAECHMPDMSGGEYAGPLAGYGFQLKWQDASLAQFLGRVRSMPLGRPRSLSSDEYLAIVAYALQKNGYPAGQADLTASAVTGWPPIRIERVQRTPDATP
jgi:mono/diheme cytochrome c family protein